MPQGARSPPAQAFPAFRTATRFAHVSAPVRVLQPARPPSSLSRRLAPPRPPRPGRGGCSAHARPRGRRLPAPGLSAAGTLAPWPHPEPPGAARAPDSRRAGTIFAALVLAPRQGGNIPGAPRPAAPVPAPPPPRVFRPSKDRATQIRLECPLPSGREGGERGPFSGRVSGAAESLVFLPKVEDVGAGAAWGRFQLLHTLE